MIVATRTPIDEDRWEAIGSFLAKGPSPLVRPDVQRQLTDEWNHVSALEARLEDALLIGLIGGTGVGKSTLINALAAAEISRSSDRRPTTDRVVVYVHRDTELPAAVPTAYLSVPYVIHRREPLTKVILLDFPDFDSVEVSHAEILRQFLPHLDVLLVIVDDMKYGDRRLYDLLTTLEMDPSNLLLVLNKLDRLLDRYGDQALQVSQDMLNDLRQNMRQYASLTVPEGQQFALSATVALAARAPDGESESVGQELPAAAGDFARLLHDIESYQRAKRRRLAKEKNIDIRKAHLAESLATEGLSASNRRMLAELEKIAHSAENELAGILQSIPSTLYTDRDRRYWRQNRLRAAASRWHAPISLILTLFAEIGRWRAGTREAQLAYRGRIERHYRSYLEAARNLHGRFDAELCGTTAEHETANAPFADVQEAEANWSASLGSALATVTAQERPRSARHHWLGHVPPLALLVAIILGKLLVAPGHTNPTGWLDWLGNSLGLLNPWFLLNLAMAMILAYLATAAVIWLREVQQLDHDMLAAERQVRQAVGTRGRIEVERVRRRLGVLNQELDLLQHLTESS